MAESRPPRTVATVIKIFIFEDSWMCREALVAVLGQEANLQVVGAAATVAEGLAALPAAKPDVVVMDLRFNGELQGIAATREVKALLPDAQVVIFTDFPQDADLEEAIQAGATGFLLKQEVQDPVVIVNAIHTVYHPGGIRSRPPVGPVEANDGLATSECSDVVYRKADADHQWPRLSYRWTEC